MGNWAITILGTGPHHNKDYPNDADKMTRKFIEELKQVGQIVESAVFTAGARNVFAPSPGYGIGTCQAANAGLFKAAKSGTPTCNVNPPTCLDNK